MKTSDKEKNKIYFTFIIFILFFIIIIGRAFFIQVINKQKLLSYSNDQVLRTVKVFPNRGRILDRNANPLAINILTYNIFALPKQLENKSKTLRQIEKVVPELSYSELKSKLSGRKRFTWLARKIKLKDDQVEKVKSLKGVFIEKSYKRYYPNNELMSQLVGFVGVDNVGLSGIEYQFDNTLKGEVQVRKYMKDAKGRPIKFESYHHEHQSQDITLSIDKDVQGIAEKYLKEAIIEHKASMGGVGVMNALNGEILALANYPNFDPNHLNRSDAHARKLSFVSDPFEPGSIFKIFTISSALENRIITPDTNYFCEHGKFRVGNHIIKESDTKKKHEWLSVEDIIKYSSNIGTTKVAFDLSYPLLDETIKKFGFGEKTNVELPAESRGIYSDNEKTSALRLSNLSFGQGVATTGIQMLAAYAAIANGGVYYRPTVLRNDNEVEGKRIIASNLASQLQDMLLGVVEEGTAQNVKIPYFKIAGKTGTAQKADSSGRYTSYIANFVGFPINVKNKFVVFAYVEDPKGDSYYGSVVAAPIVKKVIEYMLFRNKEYQNLEIAKVDVQKTRMDHVKVRQASKRILGPNLIPNFIGLDKRSASKLAKQLGIKLRYQGMGVVYDQSPTAGDPKQEEQTVNLRVRPPRYE